MRPLLPALSLLVVAGCHESELEPQTPEGLWCDRSAETTYMMAPVPAVVDPAPVWPQPRSISLGYIGDERLTPTPPSPPHWPYAPAPPFADHYRAGYGYRSGYGFAYRYRGRGYWRQ
jgi:hypothetical protein